MNINVTLIFQVINFFIAYILLRLLLFKPAYGIIRQEQKRREKLEHGISRQKGVLARKEQEIMDRWHECQEYFADNKPPIDAQELYIFKHITPPIEQPHIASDNVTHLAKDVQQVLVEKVG